MRDDGYGATEPSLEFWRRNKKSFGRVAMIVCTAARTEDEYNTLLVNEMGDKMFLSGFSCGYGGTGPCGLLELAHEAGFSTVSIEDIASTKVFTVRRTGFLGGVERKEVSQA